MGVTVVLAVVLDPTKRVARLKASVRVSVVNAYHRFLRQTLPKPS